jgi:hypothetical protein
MTAGPANGPAHGLNLSQQKLTEIRGWAAELCASPLPFLTEIRCLEALIDRLGTLISNAGGRPRPVSTRPGADWVDEPATMTHDRLRDIRGLAARLRASPAVTPAEMTRLDAIIFRTDEAIGLRHERERYWAERGQPMPAFLTQPQTSQVVTPEPSPGVTRPRAAGPRASRSGRTGTTARGEARQP